MKELEPKTKKNLVVELYYVTFRCYFASHIESGEKNLVLVKYYHFLLLCLYIIYDDVFRERV